MVLTGSKTREKIAAQVKTAADRIGTSVLAALAIAVVAVLISAAAFIVSARALRKVAA